jgi:peroxiredoxin/mono/diheme cytochrome c family protein
MFPREIVMRRLSVLSLVGLLAACFVASVHAADDAPRVGRQIQPFKLKNQFGKDYSLKDLKQDVVVVAFLGTECPLAKLYAPKLAAMAKEFPKNKVAFIGIDSNQQDSIQEIAAYATRHKIEFPLLKDVKNKVADHFGAVRTPEVFVLDKNRVVRYWGRIDDQYGFAEGLGYQRPKPTRRDLAEAVNELLAGKQVSVPTTEALGCHIGRVKQATESSEVTYSDQIARIFQAHCIECHREGRIGPFVMTSYEDVVGWGEMIREVVDQGRMPPWHASPDHGKFANESRLTDEEKQLIRTWVDNGCPEGDKSKLPAPKQFVEGWEIGEPDEIVYMSDEPVKVAAEGVIDYYHFVVDPGWTEDKWITASEAKPGSLETVHHILVFVAPPDIQPRDLARGGDGEPRRRGRGRGRGNGASEEANALTSGNLVAAYAPGANALFSNDGRTAVHVKAGSKLVFQMHYTPNGTPQTDLSYVGFKYADPDKVEYEARSTAIVNTFFSIPPGANNHSATAERKIDYDTTIVNLTPHLHTRGKAFRYEVIYPDGSQEVLLDVPQYDFNWQTTYILEEPKAIPAGSTLRCTAWWDNSEDNLSNPDPTKTVTWGEQTFEEMMIGFYVEQFPKGQSPKGSGGLQLDNLNPQDILAQLDTNKDGKLSQDEMPKPFAAQFQRMDLNQDGAIDPSELEIVLNFLKAQTQNQQNKK